MILMFRTDVRIKQCLDVGTPGGENFVIGEQCLSGQTLAFGNKDIAIVFSSCLRSSR